MSNEKKVDLFHAVPSVTEISRENVGNLFTGCFEGGYSPWMQRLCDVRVPEGTTKEDFKSGGPREYLYNTEHKWGLGFWGTLLTEPDGAIEIQVEDPEGDNEADNIKVWVGPDELKKGLELMAACKDKHGKEFPLRHWTNFLEEDYDAETSDVFAQLCIYGEIIFG